MNVALINPFLSATIALFEQMFSVSPAPGEVYLDERAYTHRWDISAVMVLTGNAIGVVAIRLTKVLADKLLASSGVTWKTEEERLDLINGMIGEIVNVIAAQASSRLVDYKINVSVPVVVQGKDHTISWPDKQPIVAIPFTTNLGPFSVNVSLFELPKMYRS